jgi:hypothetical protein
MNDMVAKYKKGHTSLSLQVSVVHSTDTDRFLTFPYDPSCLSMKRMA